jgi:predicted CoA-binding protein
MALAAAFQCLTGKVKTKLGDNLKVVSVSVRSALVTESTHNIIEYNAKNVCWRQKKFTHRGARTRDLQLIRLLL